MCPPALKAWSRFGGVRRDRLRVDDTLAVQGLLRHLLWIAAPRSTGTLTLEPGSLLCLLTDGLIDHDNRDIYTGLTTVRTVLAHSVTADSPYGLAESACAALMTTLIGDRHVDDDVTILAIGREACRGNPTTQPETSRSSTPGDLSSLAS